MAFVIIWGIAIWCMTDKDNAKETLAQWQDWVAYYFTWL
jgi:hypothetical protein